MGEFGPWHLLIVAAVFVVLFGAKRLPDAARSLGRSARIMKTELKSMHDDEPAATPVLPVVEPVVGPVVGPAVAPEPAATEPLHVS